MTRSQTARVIENFREPKNTAGSALRIRHKPVFEFAELSQCSPLTLQEIDEFLDTQETVHPFQWPQWLDERPLCAWLRLEDRIRWFAQCGVLYPASRFLRPIRALSVNRGPVCDDLDLMELGLGRLMAESRKRGFAYIDIAPEWTGELSELASAILARNGWHSLEDKRSSLRLALDPSLDELQAGLRKTTRYEIRRSEAGGIQVTIASDEAAFFEFFQLYENMAGERQFLAENVDLLLKVFRWLSKDPRHGGFFFAREEGKLRGGILVVRWGVTCWYILGATTKDGKLSAGHLLQWRAIEWAKKQGCREYDFGGFREGVTTGPAHFKSGFSDRVVHFPPTHRYVLNPSRHRALEFLSRIRRSLQA